MSLLNGLNDAQTIALGIAVILTGLVLRRGFTRAKHMQGRNPWGEAQAEFRRQPVADTATVEKLEVRLHEFARQVEARIHTRMAVLDRLIVDAEREIVRLQQVLGKDSHAPEQSLAQPLEQPQPQSHEQPGPEILRYDPAARGPVKPPRAPRSEPERSAAERADGLNPLVYQLADSGLSPEQIGRYLHQPADDVQMTLGLRSSRRFGDQADAA
jgi:hypothetical protein